MTHFHAHCFFHVLWLPNSYTLTQTTWAAAGSEPLPYFMESQTPKTYPILGKSHNPGHLKRSGLQNDTLFWGKFHNPETRSCPDSENIPYFRENVIIPGTWSGPDYEITPYFREIWWMKSHPILGKMALQNRPCKAAHPRMAICGNLWTTSWIVGCSLYCGMPPQAWLVKVNRFLMLVAAPRVSHLRPTVYCINVSQYVTLTKLWLKPFLIHIAYFACLHLYTHVFWFNFKLSSVAKTLRNKYQSIFKYSKICLKWNISLLNIAFTFLATQWVKINILGEFHTMDVILSKF